jgi:hypothetical protein
MQLRGELKLAGRGECVEGGGERDREESSRWGEWRIREEKR